MTGEQAHIFLNEHFREPTLMKPFAGGVVGVFTTGRPGEEGRVNEDAIALIGLEGSRAILVLADGAGGQPQGAKAAELAIRSMEKAVRASLEGDDGSVRGAVLDGFERANQAILELGVGAGTTLVVATITDGKLRTYHVGDSAALVVGQRGKAKFQTTSHSPVGYAVEAGVLSAKEALHHEELNVVSNLVGTTQMKIEMGPELPLAERDTVLLASDGVLDNFPPKNIGDLIRTGPVAKAAERLRKACVERMLKPREGQPSKPDDLSFVLYRRTSV